MKQTIAAWSGSWRGALVIVAACGQVQAPSDPDAATPSADAVAPRPEGDSGPGCVEPPPGLTAWWRGDGTSDDAVGDRDGTLGRVRAVPGQRATGRRRRTRPLHGRAAALVSATRPAISAATAAGSG